MRKSIVFHLFAIITFLVGCATHETLQIFPVHSNQILKSNTPIKIIVPTTHKEIVLKTLMAQQRDYPNLTINSSVAYSNLKELLAGQLIKNNIIVSNSSLKFIKLTINKIQLKRGWGGVKRCYLYFSVQTSSDYLQTYKVEDQSGWSFRRAFSGSLSRAVEKLLKDPSIIKFIEDKY
jgi:hypothetical protein